MLWVLLYFAKTEDLKRLPDISLEISTTYTEHVMFKSSRRHKMPKLKAYALGFVVFCEDGGFEKVA